MHDRTNPPPFPFDKVLENRSLSAKNSPLLKLPIEILNYIGSQLPTSKGDLASLALVNTDCRQLARSWQFRVIEPGLRTPCVNLFRLLQREGVERSQNQGRTRSLSLGACVRRLVITHNISWKELIASEPFNSGRLTTDNVFDSSDYNEERDAHNQPTVDEPAYRLNKNFPPNKFFVLSSLIHLESLEIYGAELNQILLNTMAALPVKYFSLQNVQVSNNIPTMDILEWPLQSLTILLPLIFNPENLGTSIISSFKNWELALRSCAPFLQVLRLDQTLKMGRYFAEEFIPTVFEFPKLSQLVLWGSNFGPSALRSLTLTSPCLKNLSINYGDHDMIKFLDRECHIKSLRTLIFNNIYNEELSSVSFDFLIMNSQIEGLGFYYPAPHRFLERILRLLRNFGNLKILSMTWEGSKIPESLTKELALLTQIENLHLRPGGYRNDSLICHNTMVGSLKSLRRLKRLAFTEDTYYYNINGVLTKYTLGYGDIYSENRYLHCQQMHEKAIVYADAFQNLELLHMGDITYEIIRVENDIELIVNESKRFSWEAEILNMCT